MPIIKSAKKRVKVAAKARARNSRTKRTLRDALKAFSKAVEGGKSAEIAVFRRIIAVPNEKGGALQGAALSFDGSAGRQFVGIIVGCL